MAIISSVIEKHKRPERRLRKLYQAGREPAFWIAEIGRSFRQIQRRLSRRIVWLKALCHSKTGKRKRRVGTLVGEHSKKKDFHMKSKNSSPDRANCSFMKRYEDNPKENMLSGQRDKYWAVP